MEGHGVCARGVAEASCSLSFPWAAAADGDGGRETRVRRSWAGSWEQRHSNVAAGTEFGFPLLLLRAEAARPLVICVSACGCRGEELTGLAGTKMENGRLSQGYRMQACGIRASEHLGAERDEGEKSAETRQQGGISR